MILTLFPNLDTDFYAYQTDDDKDIKKRMEDSYAQSITINQSYWSEGDIDSRFRAGDQTLLEEVYAGLPAFRRRIWNFNRMDPICNMVGGYQRKNRKNSVVIPRENATSKAADQYTKVLTWAWNKNDVLETISQAFDGALTTGMNLLSVWMDYRSDPINGDIRVDSVPYNGYLIDSFFKKQYDLSDCDFIWRRNWLTKCQIQSLFPGRKSDVDKLPIRGARDGKFQFMPESYQYSSRDLLTYDEYWYRDFRSQKLLVDLETGETLEWTGDNDLLNPFLKRNPSITVVESQISTMKLAIVVQGITFYNGPNPMGIDECPFVPVFCYYQPELPYFPWRVRGIVRGMRDAQYLYNRRKIIELDILESQITSGFKYKVDALVNPADIFLSGQGRGLAIKEDSQMTDVEQIQPPNVPPSMIELSRIMGEELKAVTGVNEELLGSATDDKSGILSMLRQGAGLTTLQKIFDQLDFSQKQLARLCLKVIQANFSPGKVSRIINEEPEPQFYNKAFGKFDIAIEDGIYSTTQKQLQFQQMLEIAQAGVQVDPIDILKASTIQGKEEMIATLQEKQDAASKAQEQAQEIELEQARAEIKQKIAQAEANRGLGLERAARVQENRALAVERLSQASKDRDLAALDMAKAAKELDSIDVDHLERLLALVQTLKQSEEPQDAAEKADTKEPNIEEIATLSPS